MNKELNIIEAMKMPVGTEFQVIHDNGRTNGSTAILGIGYDFKFLKWDDGEYLNLTSKNLNAKFIPVSKPVSFIEAIKASQEGKIIWVNVEDRTYTYYPNPKDKKFDELRAKETHGGLSTYEILNGEWYIKE